MPDTLKAVSIMGSGDIDIQSAFKDLEIAVISGSGSINAQENLDVSKFTASILGSGSINAKGKTDSFIGVISGSGNLNFSDLKAKDAKCTITGSGNIKIFAEETLEAIISGSGNVEYWGDPTLQTTVTGSGRVIKK
jgi:purine nucleoside phosphorylase